MADREVMEAASTDAGWVAFAQAAAPDARRYELFALLRHIEARARGRMRIGRSRLPSQDIVDLRQAPTLGFAGSTLASIEMARGRARVRGYYLGLTGPMAPLPLHLTEYAFDEERQSKTQPFGRFLDLLAGRMLQFFYRAWADSQPAAHADRAEDDRFSDYVAALSGATEGTHAGSAFPASSRLAYAALFAGHRSLSAIEDGMCHLLRADVTVHPFEPRWRPIAEGDRSRLGRADGFSRLGTDAVAGRRVRQVSDAFRVTIRTRSLGDYRALLPTGPRYAIAAEALAAFAPSHLEWRMELELPSAAIPPSRLAGGLALGWTSWLSRGGGSDATTYRADARFGRRRLKSPSTTIEWGKQDHG